MFPGQSSRDAEMFARAATVDEGETERALADFERLAGRPFDGTFHHNSDVQIAVHLVTRVFRRGLASAGLRPVASAGLSLGEYAHLLQIEALTEDAADALIAARGRHYDAGPVGTMVAVTAADPAEVQAVLEGLRRRHDWSPDDLAISNYNSPRQVVIAGQADAVAEAAEIIERELYAVTTTIETRVPMHVGRLSPVARAFADDLAAVTWRRPRDTWWSNVTAEGCDCPDAAALIAGMTAHVDHPVRWAPLVDALVARHPGAVFVEVGPGRVLTGLLARGRWHPDVTAIALDDPRGKGRFSQRLEEVRDACR
jgi:[acyl-carrier-protein] S-malonyltransferase